MKEINTYIIGTLSLIIIFSFAVTIQDGFSWIVGIILIIITLSVRSRLEEITQKQEKLFILLLMMLTLMTVIATVF